MLLMSRSEDPTAQATKHGVRTSGAALIATLVLTACAARSDSVQGQATSSELGIAVYTLSRAQGVPSDARAALERARDIFEAARARGDVNRIEERRFGLEGETRLCAEVAEQTRMGTLLEQVRAATEGEALVRLAEEPCFEQMPSPDFSDIG